MEALIVSNNEATIRALATQLEANRIGVNLAANNKSAIDVIKAKKPWIVFAEAKAEGIDALTILKVIEKALPEISVVALSSHFDSSQALTLMRRGFHDYIAEPFERQHDLIERAIKRARAKALYVVSYINEHDSLEEERNFIGRELQQLQEDQEAGRYVQLKLFPKNPLRLGSIEFAHRIYPSLYLSGDFIDYFHVADGLSFFYFADVSGHGASSAFITMLLKTLSHRWIQDVKKGPEISPCAYISFVNQELRTMQLGKHMTLFAGLIDEKRNQLIYSLAAHYPRPMYRQDSQIREIEETGLPVGVFPDAEYPEGCIELSDDFALFLSSDGVMEVIEASSLSEKEALLAAAVEQCSMEVERIEAAFGLAERDALPDDIGFLVVKRGNS